MEESLLAIAKYFPNQMYGFLRTAEGTDLYFHLGVFDGSPWIEPPPIIGEEVEVGVEAILDAPEGKAPKALRVRRVNEPRYVAGKVESFNAERGWGFISGDDGRNYYLHRSEVLEGKLPAAGQRVKFYGGYKNDRPRACYVTVEDNHA